MKETEQRSRGAQGRQHKKKKKKKKNLIPDYFFYWFTRCFFSPWCFMFIFFCSIFGEVTEQRCIWTLFLHDKKTVFDVTKLWDCHGRMNVNSRESCKKWHLDGWIQLNIQYHSEHTALSKINGMQTLSDIIIISLWSFSFDSNCL